MKWLQRVAIKPVGVLMYHKKAPLVSYLPSVPPAGGGSVSWPRPGLPSAYLTRFTSSPSSANVSSPRVTGPESRLLCINAVQALQNELHAVKSKLGSSC